jgi:hypothetical protein
MKPAPYYVYRCFASGGQLLYIGSARSPGTRLADHQRKHDWFAQVRGITIEEYPNEFEARAAERRAVFIERPKHNDTWSANRSADITADCALRREERRAQREASQVTALKQRIADLEAALSATAAASAPTA